MFYLFQAFQWRCNHHWEKVTTQHGCLCFAKQHPLILWLILYDTYTKKTKKQEYWLLITRALQPGLSLKPDIKQRQPLPQASHLIETRVRALRVVRHSVLTPGMSVDAPCMLTHPVCWRALYVDTPCMLTRPVCWRALYVDTPCLLTHPVCWRALYVDAPCILTHPLCWHTLYIDTPCMLTHPVCWHTLYVDAPCMLTRPVCWSALYVDTPCILTRPVCWRNLYVDAPCMLTHPVCWRTLYVDAPCMLTRPVCVNKPFVVHSFFGIFIYRGRHKKTIRFRKSLVVKRCLWIPSIFLKLNNSHKSRPYERQSPLLRFIKIRAAFKNIEAS